MGMAARTANEANDDQAEREKRFWEEVKNIGDNVAKMFGGGNAEREKRFWEEVKNIGDNVAKMFGGGNEKLMAVRSANEANDDEAERQKRWLEFLLGDAGEKLTAARSADDANDDQAE